MRVWLVNRGDMTHTFCFGNNNVYWHENIFDLAPGERWQVCLHTTLSVPNCIPNVFVKKPIPAGCSLYYELLALQRIPRIEAEGDKHNQWVRVPGRYLHRSSRRDCNWDKTAGSQDNTS